MKIRFLSFGAGENSFNALHKMRIVSCSISSISMSPNSSPSPQEARKRGRERKSEPERERAGESQRKRARESGREREKEILGTAVSKSSVSSLSWPFIRCGSLALSLQPYLGLLADSRLSVLTVLTYRRDTFGSKRSKFTATTHAKGDL